MKNYYTQLTEINVAYIRLETLIEKKRMLEVVITSCTSKLKDSTGSGSFSSDKLDSYLIKVEKINEEINLVRNEIQILEFNLRKMENALRGLKGIEERIFTLKYIDGLKPKEIAPQIPCDLATVYRYLDKINKII